MQQTKVFFYFFYRDVLYIFRDSYDAPNDCYYKRHETSGKHFNW